MKVLVKIIVSLILLCCGLTVLVKFGHIISVENTILYILSAFHTILYAILCYYYIFIIWSKKYELSLENILFYPLLNEVKAFKYTNNKTQIRKRLAICMLPTIVISLAIYILHCNMNEEELMNLSMFIWIACILAIYIKDRLSIDANVSNRDSRHINIFKYMENEGVIEHRPFTDTEKQLIREALIEPVEGGANIIIFMNNGTSYRVPLTSVSTPHPTIGSNVNLDLATIMIIKNMSQINVKILV